MQYSAYKKALYNALQLWTFYIIVNTVCSFIPCIEYSVLPTCLKKKEKKRIPAYMNYINILMLWP